MDDGKSDGLLADHCETVERLRAKQARMLHGELGGLLVAARLSLATLGPVPDATALARIDAQLGEALAIKQRAVEALRPSLLDHFGPGAALAAHFETLCRPAGLALEVDVALGLPVPAPEDAILLFRIGEAALASALRQGAEAVSLSMVAGHGEVRLRVVAEVQTTSTIGRPEIEWLARWMEQRGGRCTRRTEGRRCIVEAALPLR